MAWVSIAALPGLLLAQDVKADSMKISVMPEYDDPRVLAIFEPVISASTQLPLTAQFNIPKSAVKPQIGMACEVPDGQGHRCKVYNIADKGDHSELTYTAEQSRNLFFEYYWDPFNGKTGDKSFAFDYTPAYDISHLEITVTEPKTATNFKLSPDSKNIATSNEGLKTHTYAFDNVVKNQPISINVSYTKTDNQTSVPKQTDTQASNTPAAQQTATGGRGQVATILMLILLVIVSGVMITFWRLRSVEAETGSTGSVRPVAKPKAASTKTAPKASAKAVKNTKAAAAKFCTNCGEKLDKGAKFCPDCGEKA